MLGFFGKAPLTSDLGLFLELGILVVLLIVLRFHKIKTKQALLRHHRAMVVVIILGFIVTLSIMVHSFLNFFSAKVDLLSFFALLIIFHALMGAFALAFGITLAINVRPRKLRRWMRITMFLWLFAIVLGLILFLQIYGYLP